MLTRRGFFGRRAALASGAAAAKALPKVAPGYSTNAYWDPVDAKVAEIAADHGPAYLDVNDGIAHKRADCPLFVNIVDSEDW